MGGCESCVSTKDEQANELLDVPGGTLRAT